MKKSIIAMAVAGAIAVPAIASADATLYGTVAADGVFKNDTSSNIQVDDMIVGLKGTVDLGLDGVTGFFNFRTEFGMEGDTATSQGGSGMTNDRAFVGITGGFGTIQAGTMYNPVDATESLDRTSDGYSTDNWFTVSPTDLQNALAYVSPAMGGFTGYAGIVMDGGEVDGTVTASADNNDEDLDGYVLGFNYTIGGLSADVGYWEFREGGTATRAGDLDFVGVALDYAINDSWSVTMNYNESDNEASGRETELWGLGTTYDIGNTTLGLQYVDFDDETNGVKGGVSGDEWALTASHALGNRSKVYAQFSDADLDDNALSDAETRVLTVGYSVSF